MSLYLWIKLIHVVSATLLFGTGLGTAFFMLRAWLSNNDQAMAVTTRTVVIADWLFTTPAVVVQFITGLWLTMQLGIPFDSAWFIAVAGLFIFIGACWIPVVWIQIRIRDLIATGAARSEYTGLIRTWVCLGVPAFLSVLVLFYLMFSKAGAYS